MSYLNVKIRYDRSIKGYKILLMVMCPDSFDIKAFHANMKSIFGEKIVVNVILT